MFSVLMNVPKNASFVCIVDNRDVASIDNIYFVLMLCYDYDAQLVGPQKLKKAKKVGVPVQFLEISDLVTATSPVKINQILYSYHNQS